VERNADVQDVRAALRLLKPKEREVTYVPRLSSAIRDTCNVCGPQGPKG